MKRSGTIQIGALLKEALVDFDKKASRYPGAVGHHQRIIVEAARLVADPDTLIVEKVNGEWPEWALDAAEHWEVFTAEDGERGLRTKPTCDVFDALLAYQTGDTE